MSKAEAAPAKRFFVEMLTRDIDLSDAILDLLDNCVDGAIRTGAKNRDSPYKGFGAKIELKSKSFSITDNCGGIERSLAEQYAFRFGRRDKDRDASLATVGVYGIGMKRAIFKLGTNCVIESRHKNDQFTVEINNDWISDDANWQLDLSDSAPHLRSSGTSILVDQLHQAVQIAFDPSKTGFVENFRTTVQRHYSYIIEKGFEIQINSKVVEASSIRTLIDSNALKNKKSGIQPYIYEVDWNGVNVRLAMGLYEKLPTDREQEDSETGVRNKESAGWTIICNDRVVVASDKSRMTGWGEAGVPAYHSQFTALAGVVIFTTNDALKLPVTTTKRGIDQDSELFGQVKEVMREALKHFTSFTNKWKGQTPERDEIQSQAAVIDIRKATLQIPSDKWKEVRKGIGGKRFVPDLPEPAHEITSKRIQFIKSIEDIAIVGNYLLDDPTAKPADVGEASFDWVLKKAKAK